MVTIPARTRCACDRAPQAARPRLSPHHCGRRVAAVRRQMNDATQHFVGAATGRDGVRRERAAVSWVLRDGGTLDIRQFDDCVGSVLNWLRQLGGVSTGRGLAKHDGTGADVRLRARDFVVRRACGGTFSARWSIRPSSMLRGSSESIARQHPKVRAQDRNDPPRTSSSTCSRWRAPRRRGRRASIRIDSAPVSGEFQSRMESTGTIVHGSHHR